MQSADYEIKIKYVMIIYSVIPIFEPARETNIFQKSSSLRNQENHTVISLASPEYNNCENGRF